MKTVKLKWCLPIVLCGLAFNINAQTDASNKEIKWEKGMAWEQIKEKARQENKYIFLDCYATWCVPCKLMDKQVYSNDSIISFVNENFIAVKLQMDTTKNDDTKAKQWYAFASQLQNDLKVSGYPSYIFYSPDGELVHREIGLRDVAGFLSILKSSMNVDRQYYTLFKRYSNHNLEYSRMPYLALLAKKISNNDFAATVANDYINCYLFTLNRNDFYTKANIEFITRFLNNTHEKAFYLFYQQGRVIDSLMGKGYSNMIVDFFINKDEISSFVKESMKTKKEPDWNFIDKSIAEKFDKLSARRNVLTAKIRWYDYTKQWKKYTESLISRVNSFGAFGINILDFDLNNHAWSIFLHSNDKNELLTALKWSDSAIKLNPKYSNSYDTNANLLYKLGRTQEAITMEEKAIAVEDKQEYKDILEKIKKGVATWQSN